MDLRPCDGCEKEVLRPTIPDPGPFEHLCENCQGSLNTSLTATCPPKSIVSWAWPDVPEHVKRALKWYYSSAVLHVEVLTKDARTPTPLVGHIYDLPLRNGMHILVR